MSENPWISAVQPHIDTQHPVQDSRTQIPTWQPQSGIRSAGGLRIVPTDSSHGLWIVGAHGGAGATTLASLLQAGDAGTAWPVPRARRTAVVVVARSDVRGLQAAQRAAIQWASGAVGAVNLRGLCLIPDAPGKQLKELAGLTRLVSGAFPAVWHLDFVSHWRAHLPTESDVPRSMKKALAEIAALTERKSL